MFMSRTYLPLICLFVCSSVHWSDVSVYLSIYLSLSPLSLSPNFSFSRPTKMWSKIVFYTFPCEYFLTKVILTWKIIFIFKSFHSCFPVMNCFNQNTNVTCENKYEGLDMRGSAWKKIVSADVVPDILLSNENEMHKLNFRS